MKPIFKLLLFVTIISTCLPSCYHYHFKNADGVAVNTIDGDECIKETKHIYWWGITEKIYTTDKCNAHSFAEVKVKTNFLQTLANVITLGFWKPMTVEFYCQESNF